MSREPLPQQPLSEEDELIENGVPKDQVAEELSRESELAPHLQSMTVSDARLLVDEMDDLIKAEHRSNGVETIIQGIGGAGGVVGLAFAVYWIDKHWWSFLGGDAWLYVIPPALAGVAGGIFLATRGFIRLFGTIGEVDSFSIRSRKALMNVVNKLNGSQDL